MSGIHIAAASTTIPLLGTSFDETHIKNNLEFFRNSHNSAQRLRNVDQESWPRTRRLTFRCNGSSRPHSAFGGSGLLRRISSASTGP
jgi:hypothetical protein